MQAQQAETDLYSYSRGDIPLFNFDEADRLLIATLQELIEALRRLKLEVKTQKEETVAGEVLLGFRLYGIRDVSHSNHQFQASFTQCSVESFGDCWSF